MSKTVRVFLLAFVGLMLVEAAWIAVVPPFRGIDEHDHAYRAASVARGEWRPDYGSAVNGRGDLIPVPTDIVDAARPVCADLPYTGHDDCNGVADAGDGQVLVASGAARYNPVFYWLVGTPALPFDGDAALYAMRASSALLCCLVLAAAIAVARRFSRTWWPTTALVVAVTPMVTYSFALPAANGLEIASGVLLWVCLLSLRRPRPPAVQSRLIALGSAAAVVLGTTRALGPLWLALILATWLLLTGRARVTTLVRENRRAVLWGVTLVGLAALAGAAWSLTAGTNAPANTPSFHRGEPWSHLPIAMPWWVVQSVGVFPTAVELAPKAMYVIGLTMYGALLVLAKPVLRTVWRPMAVIVAVSAAIPVATTIMTFDRLGLSWQGRYGLPYAVGLFLIAGYALDSRRAPRPDRNGELCAGAAGFWLVATLLGVAGSLANVAEDHPYASWSAPSPAVYGSLVLLGFGLLLGAATLRRTSPAPAVRVDRSVGHA